MTRVPGCGTAARRPVTHSPRIWPPRNVSRIGPTIVPDGGGLSRSMVRSNPGRVRWIICAVTRGWLRRAASIIGHVTRAR